MDDKGFGDTTSFPMASSDTPPVAEPRPPFAAVAPQEPVTTPFDALPDVPAATANVAASDSETHRPQPVKEAEASAQMLDDTKPEPAPEHTKPAQETKPMASNFDYNRANENAKNQAQQFQAGVSQAAETAKTQTEDMMKQSQAAFQQASERSRDVMDRGMKALDEFNSSARGNADVWMASSRAAAQGLETVVQQAAEFSRKTFETATAAMRTMASARTPTDVMTAQNDFAKKQFDTIVSEFSRLTETMMKVSSQVFEPVQNHMTEAASKAGETMKGMIHDGTERR